MRIISFSGPLISAVAVLGTSSIIWLRKMQFNQGIRLSATPSAAAEMLTGTCCSDQECEKMTTFFPALLGIGRMDPLCGYYKNLHQIPKP